MKLLVLGGTVFVGRHIVEAALARGHKITLFHRGQRGADLFEGKVNRVMGDRDGGLIALDSGQWDTVIDTSGYVPRLVGDSAAFTSDRANNYLFISTISVYDAEGAMKVDESAPLKQLEDERVEEVTNDTYGGLKVLCEREVEKHFNGRSIIVRPGVVGGPHDPTDRYPYWMLRLKRGGDVLVPDRLDQPVQMIDARDLAEFCVELVENGQLGTFNAAGPQQPYSLGEFLDRSRIVANPEAVLHPISPVVLEEAGVKPWSDLPFYLGPDDKDDAILRVDASKAIAAGLHFRTLETTAKDTLEWALQARKDGLKVGIGPEKEAEILSRTPVSA